MTILIQQTYHAIYISTSVIHVHIVLFPHELQHSKLVLSLLECVVVFRAQSLPALGLTQVSYAGLGVAQVHPKAHLHLLLSQGELLGYA